MSIDDILPPSPLQDEDLAGEEVSSGNKKREALSSRQSGWQSPWSSNAMYQVARPSPVPTYAKSQLRSRPVVNLP